MIEFKCGEPASFQFEMQISGSVAGAPQVCYNIQGDVMCLSFKAVEKGSGVWSVELPVLDKFLSPGTYPCNISVMIGDHYFVPMNDTCTLKELPKPTIGGIQMTNQTAQPKVTITVPTPAPAPTVSVGAATATSQPEPAPAPEEEPKKYRSADADVFETLLKKRS